ncbi:MULTISPECIES: acyl-CoA carboxylase subunit epsilon [Streptomyces]|uniref:Acyl-CoA carboxylase subunit epsilon n=2 Tax=Streptomyces TaxID=1883 RepID=A0ABV9J2D4_9ACTN
MERLTDTPDVIRVVRGAPDPHETAALMTALVAALGSSANGTERALPPTRPTWRPFAGHSSGGWGRP